MLEINKIHCGDNLELLRQMPDESINCCVTSPPYWGLRDYGVPGQIGQEPTLNEYVKKLTDVFHEIFRVLKNDGTLWLNIGDAYCGGGRGGNPEESEYRLQKSNRGGMVKPSPIPQGLKPKDLVGLPWRVAFALQNDGWYLRSDIIWSKPNCMPESVTDRPTRAHEYVFLMTKSERYYYDIDSIREPIVTMEDRPFGIQRNRELDYDSKENALRNHTTKQDGHGRRHAGFNDRWKNRKQYEVNMAGSGSGVKGHSGYFDAEGKFIGNPLGRNKRTVWTITTHPYLEAHFATFPPELVETCIKPGCPIEGIVLDPFMGSGTTGEVALKLNRQFIGFELNPEYVKLANNRIYSNCRTLDEYANACHTKVENIV